MNKRIKSHDFMVEGAERETMNEGVRGCRLFVDPKIKLPREDQNREVQEINLPFRSQE